MAPRKQLKAMKRSSHSHRHRVNVCYRCNHKEFNKASKMEAHNHHFHCKDSKQCRLCGAMYWPCRDLKFHKAHMQDTKKKTTTESSKSNASSTSSSSNLESSTSSVSSSSMSSSASSSSNNEVDFKENGDGSE